MLHFGIPRAPEFSHVTMWRMPMSAEDQEEREERRKRTAASRTTSTLSSLPQSRYQRYNTAEGNTIYGMCRENIASRGLTVPSHPPTPQHCHLLPRNIELFEERDYIDRCLFQDYTGDNFNKMIMQNFFKAPKARNLGYGMPRPETREGVQDRMISTLSRKPSVVRVPSHTSLCKPVKCDSHTGCSEEFCEILGPGCCSSCIETTNRQIAEEIQHRLFPEIEVSRRCLVVPKLTKVMKDGHLKQMRRRRLTELRQQTVKVEEEPEKETVVVAAPKQEVEERVQETPGRAVTAVSNANAPPLKPRRTNHYTRRESMPLPPIGPPQPTFSVSSLDSRE
ncbi:hypothetical protein ElyMa_005545200 [Elysia marginata]|uniref:ARF7 effector protein C-terminal domain-containing protein n=1 Tax=Elysia marginata TaxID=1093978 RepID=A0AAV4EZL7_9GAST|nr:hypothetical protein ElyMa_005545200 [Elysia marginata]